MSLILQRSKPEHYYRNQLPHFDPKDRPYFITYRLAGSISKSESRRLFELHRLAGSGEGDRQFFASFDSILDRNGPYYLRQPEIRDIVGSSLRKMDELKKIRLLAYSIMPNHVHAVFEHLEADRPLYRLLQDHKSETARLANKALGSTGRFWAKESYDRVIRDGKQGHAIEYTLFNPVSAGFVKDWREWPGTFLADHILGF